MSKRSAVCLATALGVFALGALWGQHAAMAPAQAQEGTTVTPLEDVIVKNPVVACTPHQYSVEHDLDRFERNVLLGSRTTVQSVVLVRADGTVEVRRVGGR